MRLRTSTLMCVVVLCFLMCKLAVADGFTYQELAAPAFAINDSGTILYATISSQSQIIGSEYSPLGGINNQGNYVLAGGISSSSTLFNQGSTTDIAVSGAMFTWAAGINDSNQVVGTYRMPGQFEHGFVWQNGNYTTFMMFPDPRFPLSQIARLEPHDINNNGLVVGEYFDSADSPHGFLYDGSTYTTINYPGTSQGTYLWGVNDSGWSVGSYRDFSSSLSNGFLLTSSGYLPLMFPGSISTVPLSINDNGVIVGYYTDASGVMHGFEATMVPEPVSIVLLGSGLIGMIAMRRRLNR
jgi:uncharacterized membrane protein